MDSWEAGSRFSVPWLAYFALPRRLPCPRTSTSGEALYLNELAQRGGLSRDSTLLHRYGYLAGTAFCQGLTLVPLVNLALDVHPGGGLLLTAFAGCSVAFACFSGAAALSRRRSYLFLAGLPLIFSLSILAAQEQLAGHNFKTSVRCSLIWECYPALTGVIHFLLSAQIYIPRLADVWAGGLSSAMSLMLVMRLGSLFFGRGVAAFNVELYGGLLVFLGYILVDTQVTETSFGAMGFFTCSCTATSV